MELIQPIHAAYASIIGTILIGIFAEGAKAQLENVLSNIVSFILLLATTNMPDPVLLALSIYIGLGIFIVARKIKELYLLFGSKSYGAIGLVLLFAEGNHFWMSFNDQRSLLIGCVVSLATVHIVGYAYSRRSRRGKRGRGRRKGRKAGRKR
ncbi:MAG: hypothetical protein QW379_07575 [Thermoplasmata archaeon]